MSRPLRTLNDTVVTPILPNTSTDKFCNKAIGNSLIHPVIYINTFASKHLHQCIYFNIVTTDISHLSGCLRMLTGGNHHSGLRTSISKLPSILRHCQCPPFSHNRIAFCICHSCLSLCLSGFGNPFDSYQLIMMQVQLTLWHYSL